MTHLMTGPLTAWLALPLTWEHLGEAVAVARSNYGADPRSAALFTVLDFQQAWGGSSSQDGQAGVMATHATTGGQPLPQMSPMPGDDLDRAADLVLRIGQGWRSNRENNHAREEQGLFPQPCPNIAAYGAQLASLVAAGGEFDGLGSVLASFASAVQFAHSANPLAPQSRSLLRDAVDRMTANMPRLWVGEAFRTLADAAQHAGREDLWQEEVEYLLTSRGRDCPVDVARAIALQSWSVIADDARWIRAQRTRDQSERLLNTVQMADADLGWEVEESSLQSHDDIRVKLSVAFLYNRDLDERPWTETADEVVTDLVARLSPSGVNSALVEIGNVLLETGASPAHKAELLQRWSEQAARRGVLDASVAAEVDRLTRELTAEGTEPGGKPETTSIDGSPQGTWIPGVSQGVPPGLYSEDVFVREAALDDEFHGWATRNVYTDKKKIFKAAIAACAEMYTRGINDPAEIVQEKSVIFVRRIIVGYLHRDDIEKSLRWNRRVVADMEGKLTPRCKRARVQAIWELVCHSWKNSEVAWAERELEALLEDNYADYAVLYRAELLDRRARKCPSGPQRIALREEAVNHFIQGIDLDEYEQMDCAESICRSVADLINEYRMAGNAEAMVASAAIYVEWIPSPITAEVRRDLSDNVLRQLRSIPESADPNILERRQAIFDRVALICGSSAAVDRLGE